MGKKAWLLAVTSGIAQALVFPGPEVYWLAWICLTPLLVALVSPRADGEPPSPRQGFLLGWVSGTVWVLGSFYWVFHTLYVYAHVHAAISGLLLLGFSLYFALYHGLFGMMVAMAARSPRLGRGLVLALSPVLWVATELARLRTSPFPTGVLGASQLDNLPLAQIATVTGEYGLAFVVAVVNAAFALAWLFPPARKRIALIALASALVLQAGAFVKPAASPASHTAVLVQPNIPVLDTRWTMGLLGDTLAEMSRLSSARRPADESGLGVVVWPESPAPFLEYSPLVRVALSRTAQATQSWVVAGTLGTRPVPAGSGQRLQVLNSASLISPAGMWTDRYDKVHQVPFGEYVPFRRLLFVIKPLTRGVGDYAAGERRKVMQIDRHTIAVIICYEAIFPDEVREFVAGGAEVLVNISNDTWLGETGGPYQHLNMARMRAIENRRWLLRATNSGITAVIDPQGRVVARASRNTPTALVAPYEFIASTTFYTRHGDVFAFACAITSALVLALALATR